MASQFPSLEATSHAVITRKADQPTTHFPPIDLQQMLDEEAFQAEDIASSIWDLDAVKVPWRFQLAMGLINIVSIFAIGLLAPDLDTLRISAGMLAGSAFGALARTMFPILRASRRAVDPLAVYRKFGVQTTRSASVTFRG